MSNFKALESKIQRQAVLILDMELKNGMLKKSSFHPCSLSRQMCKNGFFLRTKNGSDSNNTIAQR